MRDGLRFPLTAAQRARYRLERWRRYWWPGLLKPPRHFGTERYPRESVRLADLREPRP